MLMAMVAISAQIAMSAVFLVGTGQSLATEGAHPRSRRVEKNYGKVRLAGRQVHTQERLTLSNSDETLSQLNHEMS
jgi:hypothetical protein